MIRIRALRALGVLAAFVVLTGMLGGVLPSPAWADKSDTSQQLVLSQVDQDWLAAHPVVRVGIDTGYGPYSFLDEQGNLQGVVSEFLAYIGPALGVHFELITDLDWPQLMAAVQDHRIDVVATVAHLPEREAFLEFTAIYLPTPLVIMTRDETPQLHSIDDLAKMSLVLVQGYSSSKEVMERYPSLQPHYVAAPSEALMAVASGATDATVGALGVSTYLAVQHGFSNLRVNAAFDMSMNGQRFGVRKDWPQLAGILDRALVAMPAQRKNEIIQAWMPGRVGDIHRLSQPTLIARLFPWLAGGLGLAVLGYLVILLWNRQLRHELARRRVELERAQHIAHLGDWSMDLAGNRIQCSDELFRMAGRSPCELDWPTLRSWIHPEEREANEHYLSQLAVLTEGESLPPLVSHLLRPDGSSCWLEITCTTEFDPIGKPCRHIGTALDITERKAAEVRISRLNRLYRVLSGINEAIVRLRDPQALFDEACRIAVEVGGFRMAWLGMVSADSHHVRPVAYAGVVEHYLENIHISLGEDEYARGPTGTALREGQHVVCNDIANDSDMAPWCNAAQDLGYRASAAFPIRVDGQVRGTFNLYSDRAGFFDDDELHLLDKLAEDIGFALEFIEADLARASLNRHMVDLLESMSDGFVSLDRTWCYQYVNRKAGEMFGRSPADLIGKHIWTEFPEEVGQPFQAAYEQVMQGGEMLRLENYYPPWDQWYENRIYPTHDGISIFFTDVTERKKQETELKRLHSILNALVTGSTDAIFVKDREGRYLVVNQAMSALVGRPMEAILGTDDHALFAVELAERLRADDQRILKTGAALSYEEVVATHDAIYQYLTTKGPLIIDGEVRGVFGIARDITGRKRVEAALLESESRLRLFIEHAPAALAMFDCEMRYLAFSARWLSDYDLESDILGQSHYAVFPDIPESWKAAHRRGLSGEVVRSIEDQFDREDGSVIWLRWEVRPWIGADGGVGGICIFSEDITANKNVEAELRRQKDLLTRTGRLAKVGGWEIDVATMQYTMTDEVFRIFDLEPDPQVTEAPLIACLLESDRRRLDQVQRDAIESHQPYELELELTTAKDACKWIHVVGLPVREGDRVVRLEGAVQDISERKQVEERARQSRLVLDSVFQALPDLFFLMDANGTIRDYRAQKKSKLYVPPNVFLGKRIQDVVPSELGVRFGNKIEETGKRGGLITFEYDLPMSDGSQHFEARLTQLPGSTQLIAVVRDITRQYKDHLALGDSELRYRHLFERSPAPMLVYELGSLRLLAVNEAFMRHYGYSHDEALALKLPDLYPDEEKQSVANLTTRLAGLAYVGEWHHLKKDGSQITVEERSHNLQYEGRDARVAVITDITERRQAEQILQDSEARYRSLLELAPFPAVLTRVRDGILLYGNHRAEVQYGISRENGIGQSAERFYEDRLQRDRFLEPLQKTGKVDDLEVRMRTADGQPFWALVSASVVEFENEPAIFTAINDITARKQTEAALQEQETFFRLIAENMGDLVAVLDLDGRRLYNSPSYQTLFGDPDALKGTDSFAEIHPDDQDRVREVFMETVRTGHGHRADFRFVLPDGQLRYMESQGGVIHGADGQVERVVVVSRDVTERRQMEDEIRQLNTELEERVRQRTAELANANKELETFTYSVSHDLKAPLRGIDGYSRLLLEDYQDRLDQAGRQLVNNVRSGVAQMSQLIEDLLAYSRMERRSLLGQTLDLPQVVAKVLGKMQAGIQQHGMVVDTSLQGLTVRADPEGLSIVLRNLIDNAIKFSRDSHPPTLSISGVAGEKSITLIVRDNGIGFDMQFHDRIFEIFQRLQRAEEYPGTGVGLAIVYKAMQRMGGDVRAESEPGKGATFYLELPR